MTKNENSRRFMGALLAAMLLVPTFSQAGQQSEPVALSMAAMEDLGDQRYRIGEIIVDKAAGEFTLPGKILHLREALEYVAVSRDGMKGYESLLELSTSPMEFNLACILIGLDDENSVKPRYQFDELKPEGQAVAITIHWQQDGKTMSVSAAQAMTAGEAVYDDDGWVYIGSTTSEDGQQFMADMTGTLIGFVHDPYSVIEHHNGAGIGAYGIMTGNEAVLPPEGSDISVSVAVLQR